MTAHALLIDIDGVLTVSWTPIPGSVDAFGELRQRKVPLRLATNTTSASRAEVADRLAGVGFDVSARDILTAPLATAVHLRTEHAGARVFLLSSGDLADDLSGIDVVGEQGDADVVVLGGAGLTYSHEQLNHALRLLLDGAAFVAMHRNLMWRTERGMELDTGAYVSALEAATGRSPTVIGKPSPAFFEAGRRALAEQVETDLLSEDVMMIGDDVVNDVGGAQAVGMSGCLVRTGKFRQDSLVESGVEPTFVVDKFADAVALLDESGA